MPYDAEEGMQTNTKLRSELAWASDAEGLAPPFDIL